MGKNNQKTVEQRLQEIEDVREITDLFYAWHYACTGGFMGKQPGRMEALDCLTDDATIEVLGLHETGKGPKGREEYTEFWEYFYGDDGPLPYVFQTSVADKVEVDGDTAVHYTNMLGIFQNRGADAYLNLSQRINYLRRTEEGWRITKTTVEGGYSTTVQELRGQLNKLPEKMAERTPWTYKG